MKRYALGVVFLALACPSLAFGAVVPATNRFVGPDFPILVDNDGNGPDAGDTPIVPTVAGSVMTIPNPWENCNNADGPENVLQLQSLVIAGPPLYTGGTRTTDNQTESIVADQFASGRPTRFHMQVNKNSNPSYRDGYGTLLDQNHDGIYDALQGSGDNTFLLDLVLDDIDNDGFGDYVSIPWGQASALGVDTTDGCNPVAGGDPQIWVPLADTNGDNIPDAIALDLNGDRIRDPQFLASPAIGGPSRAGATIPTLSEWASILATLALAAIAWMQIRAHGLGA